MRYFLGFLGCVLLSGFVFYADDQTLVTHRVDAPALQKMSGAALVFTAQAQAPDVQALQREIPVKGSCAGKFNVKIQDSNVELCPTQYKIDVPEEAEDMLIELEKGGKFDMSFAIAPNDPVGTSGKNFFIFTRRGKDIFNSELGVIDRDGGLETGPWYIAILNYEEKARDYSVIASPDPVVLKSGEAYNGSILDNTIGGRSNGRGGLLGFVDYKISVPQGTTSFKANLHNNSSGSINLYIRFDKPVDLNRDGDVLADYIGERPGKDVSLTVTDKSNPPLKAGNYYLKVANFDNQRQLFVLTATAGADTTQPPPAIKVQPGTLSFNAEAGGRNPASQQIQITNGGGGTLNWKATVDQPWVSVDPASGTAPSNVNVNVNIAGLAAGTQKAKVTIAADGANNSPQTVDVTLTLTQPQPQTPPTLQVKPQSLTFNATVNGSNPAGQTLEITNSGGGTLNWTAVADVPWISLSANSGAAPATVTVNVNIAGLAVGTQQGRIIVSAQGAGSSPQLISVTLNIAPPTSTAGQVFAIRFVRIEFPTPEKWDRSVKDGCVVYKNISNGPATVKFTLNNGDALSVDIPAGKEVIVCGTIAHIDTRP
ncbi:BACON domain-containing protein [Candidatus Acetothermia bacterium]|nr:BACON domain-containing protein [Candidatus Acetothermia bacterium]